MIDDSRRANEAAVEEARAVARQLAAESRAAIDAKRASASADPDWSRTFTAVCDDCQIPMTFYSSADQYGWAVQHSCTHNGHTVVLAASAG
jgi:hypothetical protein